MEYVQKGIRPFPKSMGFLQMIWILFSITQKQWDQWRKNGDWWSDVIQRNWYNAQNGGSLTEIRRREKYQYRMSSLEFTRILFKFPLFTRIPSIVQTLLRHRGVVESFANSQVLSVSKDQINQGIFRVSSRNTNIENKRWIEKKNKKSSCLVYLVYSWWYLSNAEQICNLLRWEVADTNGLGKALLYTAFQCCPRSREIKR